jgi:hypothetical protein
MRDVEEVEGQAKCEGLGVQKVPDGAGYVNFWVG